MRVAFLGTADFGIPALQALLQSEHEVVGVVTGADKPAGRGRKLIPTPVKQVAEQAGLPVLTPGRFKDPAFLQAYNEWQPDAAVVVAFRILPPEVFDLPTLGTLNIHPSLLPAYRGPAPLNWALINGEKETGVSIIRISRKVDAGGVLLQRRIELHPLETASALSERLAPIGGEMVLEALAGIEHNRLSPIEQDESNVTKAPKLTKEDGLLDWTRPALEVHNRARGVTFWPGAYTFHEGLPLKLYCSRPVEGMGKPGEVLETGRSLVIACGDGAVSFGEIQKQGKKRMEAEAFFRGATMKSGDILGKTS